jgi:RNA 2',3'-cyclic 3'-phosphodiesterase
MVRLFFALPAEEIEGRLAPVYEQLAKYPKTLKMVAPKNYHITLKFLGGTKPEVFMELKHGFSGLRLDETVLPFRLNGLGGFPGVKNARVIWCGLEADLEAICRIQNAIEDLSAKYGFLKEERGFRPHLTIARTKRDAHMPSPLADYIAGNRDTVFGESKFDRVVLYKSDLGREGPTYTEVDSLPLK